MSASDLADFTEAIRLDPDYRGSYHNRGFAYRNLEKYDLAIADYTEAIRLEPGAITYYHRGAAYQSLGKVEEAERDFAKAKSLGVE